MNLTVRLVSELSGPTVRLQALITLSLTARLATYLSGLTSLMTRLDALLPGLRASLLSKLSGLVNRLAASPGHQHLQ